MADRVSGKLLVKFIDYQINDSAILVCMGENYRAFLLSKAAYFITKLKNICNNSKT
jgi:hypothetical protein